MPQTDLRQSITKQIKALEFARQKAVLNEKPTANIWAINGKINKLMNQLRELNKFEYLAK